MTNLNAQYLGGLAKSAFSLAGHTHDASFIVSGTLASPRLAGTYARAVTFNNAGNNCVGNFSGNDSGLSGVPGSTLASLGIKSGTVSGSSDATFFYRVTVTFSTSYPNANYSITVTGRQPASPGAPPNGSYTSKTASGFTLILNNSGPSGATLSGDWMTVPYSN